MKPYYEDGLVTIYHGDCREILPTVEAYLLLTDPPYNRGIDYDGYDDSLPPDEYKAFTAEWFTMAHAAVKASIVFPGHGNLPIWFDIAPPTAVGCWYKPGNPASSFLGFCEWEPWLYWGKRLGGSDTIRATVNRQTDTGDHPCPKPDHLMGALLGKTKAESVIDPFLGSGSTVYAAKAQGIRAFGIEQSERYCEIAAKRCAQEVLDLSA